VKLFSLTKKQLPALLLTIILLALTPLLSACGAEPAVGEIDDTASLALLSYETFAGGIDGVVYRRVNRFSTLMAQSEEPLLVVFYSPLAEVNIQVIPRLEQLAFEYHDRLKIVWVDASAETAMAESFKVESLPQFTVVVESSVKRSLVGYDDEGSVRLGELLEPYITEP